MCNAMGAGGVRISVTTLGVRSNIALRGTGIGVKYGPLDEMN